MSAGSRIAACAGSASPILALLTAGLIFPLVFVGAGVTSKGAGMVFPDWPTSDGAVLNPEGWLKDEHKRWEHGHRLIGWAVGMLAIGSAAASWFRQGPARALTLVTLGMIIVQGLLGGFRVTEILQILAMIHGIWGQLTFCVAAVTVLFTWSAMLPTARVAVPRARFFQVGAAVALGAVFLQLCLGAWYRHFGSNTALLAHVMWAVVVFLILSWLTMWALEQYPRLQPLSFLGKSMAVLIAAQMVLGGAAFLIRVMGIHGKGFIQTMAPTAHVAAGALMLACTAMIMIAGMTRLSALSNEPVAAPGTTVTT